MAICDRCDNNVDDVHRYLFYSSGLITTAISIEAFGVNSEIGLLLLCQRCTETLMTTERFSSTTARPVNLDAFTEIASAWNAADDVRDAGIIERCRAVGFGPIEATVAARQQAEKYDMNPDKNHARLHAIRFWNPG
jgi:hypothetical protein